MLHDEDVSTRTIQRDIENMRTCERIGYYAPIEYHRGQNGYYYTKSDYELVKKISLETAWSVVREAMETQLNLK
jgi:predicted DNA-binding transcriptional regulator YafY